MKIYVASSWRNKQYERVVEFLRDLGHQVYDFKQPHSAFSWADIDYLHTRWKAKEFRDALKSPLAEMGFKADMEALEQCDVCVLLLPCGSSAHLELGFARGAKKKTIIYLDENLEKGLELMYKMADQVVVSNEELVEALLAG